MPAPSSWTPAGRSPAPPEPRDPAGGTLRPIDRALARPTRRAKGKVAREAAPEPQGARGNRSAEPCGSHVATEARTASARPCPKRARWYAPWLDGLSVCPAGGSPPALCCSAACHGASATHRSARGASFRPSPGSSSRPSGLGCPTSHRDRRLRDPRRRRRPRGAGDRAPLRRAGHPHGGRDHAVAARALRALRAYLVRASRERAAGPAELLIRGRPCARLPAGGRDHEPRRGVLVNQGGVVPPPGRSGQPGWGRSPDAEGRWTRSGWAPAAAAVGWAARAAPVPPPPRRGAHLEQCVVRCPPWLPSGHFARGSTFGRKSAR
jgi:hypothetical protein